MTVTTLAALGVAIPAFAHDQLRLERVNATREREFKEYLSFVDGDGHVISGETKDDFQLIIDSTDSGTAEQVTTFDLLAEPINVVIVAQISPTVSGVLEDIKKGERAVAAAVGKQGKVGVVHYSGDAQQGSAFEAAAAALLALVTGRTLSLNFLEAVRLGLDMLAASPSGQRKLLVVFSDGVDDQVQGHRDFVKLGARALDSDVVIDLIGYPTSEADRLKDAARMSKQSNGVVRTAKVSNEIGLAFNDVVDEIKHEYVVWFRRPWPLVNDEKDRVIQVHINGARAAHSSAIGAHEAYSNVITVKILTPPPTP